MMTRQHLRAAGEVGVRTAAQAMRNAGDEAGGPSSDGAAHHHLTTLPIPLRIAPISRWLDEGAHAHGAGEEWAGVAPCTLEQAGRRAGRGFR